MLDFFSSWFAIAIGAALSVVFMIAFIWCEFHPPIMRKIVFSVKKRIRKVLRKNKTFMSWLYGKTVSDQIQENCYTLNVKIYRNGYK